MSKMPDRPATVSEQEWREYKWEATVAQGEQARRRLAARWNMPVIPPDVLAI
ncbi:hypothetical protein [Bifidobacterium biavatii]|uniref:Uncharacterized protein n=1 Tax=Bifidobacterium biavatii DSM 23969 TaxID=1437608 RepID=A0A086ZYY3_9BIFI|nr:hypothetical protein [Bifidobacterium biavatii]KFI51733.1 hypothetical protein BBIA_0647 [Bifidobacterium biavatii DSM 23969]